MPVATHSIVFARIVPSELNIVTAENNNVIDLALQRQIKRGVNPSDGTAGDDIWQKRDNFLNTVATTRETSHAQEYRGSNLLLNWSDFKAHFYGGGDGDFGLSQIVGRRLTLIGVAGEYANGIGQTTSALTHMSDRGSGAANISGVSVMNDVIDSVVLDLGLPHEAWDSCSYMNVVNNLQDVHTLEDVTRVEGKLQQSCSLSMAQLIHEIASNYDENIGESANSVNSAVFTLYNTGLDAAVEKAMDARPTDATGTGEGKGVDAMHDLVLSVMFKNSTPGVRNIEFRIHMLVAHNGTGKIGPRVDDTTAGQTVSSATAGATSSETTITVVTATNHGLESGDKITVTAGSTNVNDVKIVCTNGEITRVDPTTFTFTSTNGTPTASTAASTVPTYVFQTRKVDLTDIINDGTSADRALPLNGVST